MRAAYRSNKLDTVRQTKKGQRMTKRAESKYKINRRLGVNLWGRPKSPINKREYGPGQHGQRRKKPSDFGVQLMAKQKMKGYYGNISEKQFRKYYEGRPCAARATPAENLIELLERRLDAVHLPHEVRHHPLRGPAVRQPRPHARSTASGVNISELPGASDGDDDRGEARSPSSSPWCSTRTQSAERDVPDYTSRSITAP